MVNSFTNIRFKCIWFSMLIALPLPNSFAHDNDAFYLGVWGTEVRLSTELVLYNNRNSKFKGIRLHLRNEAGVILLGNYVDYAYSTKYSSINTNVVLKTKRCGLFIEEHDVELIKGEAPNHYYLVHDYNEYIYWLRFKKIA